MKIRSMGRAASYNRELWSLATLRVKRGKLVQPDKIGVHLSIMGIFNDVQTQIQMRRCDSVQGGVGDKKEVIEGLGRLMMTTANFEGTTDVIPLSLMPLIYSFPCRRFPGFAVC